MLRDLRKGLKVLVVQPIERLMTVLPLFLTAHEVKIFNLESDLDTVIERLKNSDGENKVVLTLVKMNLFYIVFCVVAERQRSCGSQEIFKKS